MKKHSIKIILSGISTLILNATAFAQDAATTEVVEKPMDWSFLPTVLATIAVILLITITLFSSIVKGLGRRVEENSKKATTIILIFALQLLGNELFAKNVTATHQISHILTNSFLITVILVEILVLFYLNNMIKVLLNVLSPVPLKALAKENSIDWQALWTKIVGLKPIEQEADLRMNDHIYDGTIQELDNRMPPWLAFIFNGSIAFAVIYLFLYQYSDWGPDPIREYTTEVHDAMIERAAYLDKQANNVNENNVVALLDAQSLSIGAAIYKQNCTACHGDKGQGGVGTNLTDDYWLHGGSIKTIFKTIAYGVEEKGMRSWKNDILPSDIQKVASFIKSLKGTNPAGAKAPQGDLEKEEIVKPLEK